MIFGKADIFPGLYILASYHNQTMLRSLFNCSFDALFEFVVSHISLLLNMVLSSFKWRGLIRERNDFKQTHLHGTVIKNFLLLGI